MERCLATIQFTIVLKQQQKLGVIRFIKNGKAVNSFGGNCWEVQLSGPLAAAWVWGNRIFLPVKHVALLQLFSDRRPPITSIKKASVRAAIALFLHLQFNTPVHPAVAHAVLRTTKLRLCSDWIAKTPIQYS